MKWLTLAGILLYLTRCSDAGVLKCSPESRDPLCASEKRDISTPSSPPDAECLAGSEWESNCHFCRCSDSGIAECLKQDSCELQVFERQIPAQDSQKKCEPGSKWKESCNSCWCTDDGVSICTKIGCVSNINKREAPVQSDPNECEPGTSWKKSCNTCWCTDNGIPLCTKKGCLDSITLPRIEKRDTAKSAATTTKSSNSTKRVVCIANRMFIMDCNTCWCNEDGTSFFCTRRICTPDSTEDDNTEYPEVEMKLKVIEKECRPNEVFELDCNMCRCNADGTSFSCTRRACVDVEDKNATLTRKTRGAQLDPPKTCQPGTEFRMDCNKCLCNDEGQDFSCTRIDCAAQNGNGGVDSFPSARSKRELSETVSMECVAGSVFDRECNVCRCTADGRHAVCTLKRCKQETTEPDTESTPSFRCTPGDQFKRDCNDCTCSADGKTVFCTLRLCDQVVAGIDGGQ